ncbi:hypothetical protein V9T40_002512 [Parthenolecanium corni]|uniref:Cytochrome P450 n=1 Tax=Parthenolecanium corni TaxID=536013 RepID=A0AAN9Y4A4_9HEMI
MKIVDDLHKEFNGFFKVWTGFEPIVFISKPEAAEVIFKSSTNIDRSFDYKFLIPWLGTGLLTSTGEKQKKAFLDLLLGMAEESSKPFTTADIREEVDTFMFAGHDSSSSATAYAVFLLGCHPEIQEKVFQELYSVFGSSDRFPTKADISQLTYLECVTRESLRLYPVVPVIGRILVEDTELDGYLVPAGTTIDINISAIHRNANHFPEPNKFNPDNFSPENRAKRHPFAFVPFSAGVRNCIGRKFASDEEMILLSTLFRKYKVESLQKPEELQVEPDLVMRPKNGIKVRISRRLYPSD